MYNRKPSFWLLTGIFLIIVGGLLLPGATARSAWTPPPPSATAWTMAPQALTASTAPISIEIDEEGYTTWTYDYSYDREALPDFCWPYSRIAWDFDLGTQDPTELSETTLIIAFAQMHFVWDENGPRTTDPTWGVALNGFPTAAYQEAIALESGFPMHGWNIIGAIGAAPQASRQAPRVVVEQEIPFDFSNLVDGDNRIHFRQSDFCPLPELWDSACTCFEIFSIKLRARIKLGISEMSPPPDARNVRVNQHQNSEIRIKFTTYVSPTTVNAETFQVFYYDQDLNQVVVDGSVSQLSDMEFVFTPAPALKDGIRYEVQVWDWDEARRHGRDQWVTDLANGPLENGSIWSFWTLPNLQVHLVPVQVLQDMPLIVNKATALRTFIRWEAHPNVFALDQLEEIEVYDLTLRWRVLGGGHQGRAGWRDSKYGWNLPYSSQNALRKREYLTFNTSADSYDKFERMAGRDSLTYFGFIPLDSGTYDLLALVTLLDQKGEPNIHVGASITAESLASRRLNLHYRAVAVGADYGATGTRDLSESLLDSGNVTRALLPVPSITRAATPGAMPYYHPTTSLWIGDWIAPPSWPYYRQIKYLLQELSMLCARSKEIHNQPCDAMIGYVPQGWLGVNGITLPDAAPWGALAQHDTTAYSNLHFVPVHELGHLFGFIEHNDALESVLKVKVTPKNILRKM